MHLPSRGGDRRAVILVAVLVSCAGSGGPAVEPVPRPSGAAPSSAPTAVGVPVVVFDFEDGGSIPPRPEAATWSRALASLLSADLAGAPELEILDRAHLDAVLREQRLSRSRLADEGTRLELGRLTGARFMIFGTYLAIGDRVTLVARLSEVETSRVLKVAEAKGAPGDLRALSRGLAGDLIDGLGRRLAWSDHDRRAWLEARGEGSGTPAAARALIDEGRRLLEQGEADEAIDRLVEALALAPADADARALLERASERAIR